jgi:hypothetical protein
VQISSVFCYRGGVFLVRHKPDDLSCRLLACGTRNRENPPRRHRDAERIKEDVGEGSYGRNSGVRMSRNFDGFTLCLCASVALLLKEHRPKTRKDRPLFPEGTGPEVLSHFTHLRQRRRRWLIGGHLRESLRL